MFPSSALLTMVISLSTITLSRSGLNAIMPRKGAGGMFRNAGLGSKSQGWCMFLARVLNEYRKVVCG